LYRNDQVKGYWISGVPEMDFVGTVKMSCPEYLVELSLSAGNTSSDDDDDDDGHGDSENS
jgi:hypothetical protein